MSKPQRKSTLLRDFSTEQLALLVTLYPLVQRELGKQGELSTVRLQDIGDADVRLAKLGEMEACGDLWIRISYAGNLNVMARAAPEAGGRRYVPWRSTQAGSGLVQASRAVLPRLMEELKPLTEILEPDFRATCRGFTLEVLHGLVS